MSFSLLTSRGVFDLSARAQAIQMQDRQRDYAMTQSRAVESGAWEMFGDTLENPSPLKLRMYLKPGRRTVHRMVIDQVDAALAQATVLQSFADLREYPLAGARITLESPTEDAYALELTFWPSKAKPDIIVGYPFGLLHTTASANGVSTVEALAGTTITRKKFTLHGLDGKTYEFDTLGVD